MADSEISVKVVADIEDIKKSLKEISASSKKSSDDIGSSFGSAAGKFSLLATGINQGIELASKLVDAFKRVAIETAIIGERAAQVENGFRRLADQAGISSENLISGIREANAGVIDMTELLRRSSQLIVSLSSDARRLPEVIELSRKIAVSYGVDASEAFDQVSRAIVTNNAKALKQIGINIDANKAIRDFALANGIAENAITATGRAQALLGATLEAGKKSFGSTKIEVNTVSNSWDRLNSTIKESIAVIGLWIAKTGTLQSAIDTTSELVKGFANAFKSLTGQQVGTEIDDVAQRIERLNRRIELMQRRGQTDNSVFRQLNDDLAEANSQMERLVQKQQVVNSKKVADVATPKTDIEDPQIRAQNEAQFQKQLNQIRLQNAQEKIKLASSEEELAQAQRDREVQLEAEKEARIAEVKQQSRQFGLAGTQQEKFMLQEIQIQHEQRMLEIQRQAEEERMMMLQTKLEMSTSVDDQIAVSAELQAARTAQAWRKSGQLGGAAVASFSNRTMKAFEAVGAGTATMSEAMRSAFFGMLGDVASAQGKTMFLTNLAPPLGPNPAGMAAGLGLIALGGLLSSMGGGAAKLTEGGVGGGGAGGGFGGGFGGPSLADMQEKRKEVTINIEGNYFESEQTKLAIVEALRSASDATDFTIQRGNRR